jgi:hypothetical protein
MASEPQSRGCILEFNPDLHRDWAIANRNELPLRPANEAPAFSIAKTKIAQLQKEYTTMYRNEGVRVGRFQEISIDYSQLLWRTAPVRWLPEEILSMIFSIACGPNTRFGAAGTLHIIMKTCHRWRIVAEGTAPLWTQLWLLSSAKPWSGDKLRRWLINSRNAALDLRVCCSKEFNDEELLQSHLPRVMEQSDRFSSLAVVRGPSYRNVARSLSRCMDSISEDSPGSPLDPDETGKRLKFSSLTYFHLSDVELTRAETQTRLLRLMDAPKLVNLHLVDVELDIVTYSALVAGTPNVVVLTLHADWDRKSIHNKSLPIAHRKLKVLAFKSYDEGLDEGLYATIFTRLVEGVDSLTRLDLEMAQDCDGLVPNHELMQSSTNGAISAKAINMTFQFSTWSMAFLTLEHLVDFFSLFSTVTDIHFHFTLPSEPLPGALEDHDPWRLAVPITNWVFLVLAEAGGENAVSSLRVNGLPISVDYFVALGERCSAYRKKRNFSMVEAIREIAPLLAPEEISGFLREGARLHVQIQATEYWYSGSLAGRSGRLISRDEAAAMMQDLFLEDGVAYELM